VPSLLARKQDLKRVLLRAATYICLVLVFDLGKCSLRVIRATVQERA
jgi:hypothetical protein